MRGRFVDVVERQIALFTAENAGLIRDTEAALDTYNRSPRNEAEERYGDYLDLVESGTDELVELRDNFASTLDEDSYEEYHDVFNRVVRKRLPRFGLQLDYHNSTAEDGSDSPYGSNAVLGVAGFYRGTTSADFTHDFPVMMVELPAGQSGIDASTGIGVKIPALLTSTSIRGVAARADCHSVSAPSGRPRSAARRWQAEGLISARIASAACATTSSWATATSTRSPARCPTSS